MTHVFVVPGDITRLAADAWLLPTDRTLHVTAGWYDAVPTLRDAVGGLGAAADELRQERTHALALPHWPAAEPNPVLVAVPFGGVHHADHVVVPVTEALRIAAGVARARTRRAVPLVALPAFGSSGGGGDDLRGELLRTLLEVAATVGAETRVDVALVLTHRSDLALAQGLRRCDPATWSELGEDLQERARGLAELAAAGQLVPFIGAGVSASAGLPT